MRPKRSFRTVGRTNSSCLSGNWKPLKNGGDITDRIPVAVWVKEYKISERWPTNELVVAFSAGVGLDPVSDYLQGL